MEILRLPTSLTSAEEQGQERLCMGRGPMVPYSFLCGFRLGSYFSKDHWICPFWNHLQGHCLCICVEGSCACVWAHLCVCAGACTCVHSYVRRLDLTTFYPVYWDELSAEPRSLWLAELPAAWDVGDLSLSLVACFGLWSGVRQVSKDLNHSQCALCLLLIDQDVSSQFFLLPGFHSTIMDSKPLGLRPQLNSFFYKLPCDGVPAIGKRLRHGAVRCALHRAEDWTCDSPPNELSWGPIALLDHKHPLLHGLLWLQLHILPSKGLALWPFTGKKKKKLILVFTSSTKQSYLCNPQTQEAESSKTAWTT